MKRLALIAALTAACTGPLHAQERDVIRIQVGDPVTIDGIPCGNTGRARAETWRSGALRSCPIATPLTLAGHALPAGSWIYLAQSGTLERAWLSRDTALDGRMCKGTGYDEWITEFHPNGRLRLCYLPEDAEIDGVPCRRGTIWGEVRGGVKVQFHENGALESCTAARSTTVDGRAVKKWQRVRLDAQGRFTAVSG